MKKNLYVLEAVNCVAFYNQLVNNKETMNKLPLKIKWALKRAIEKINVDAKAYEEFRDAELQKIRDVYFDETHADKTMVPELDEAGNPAVDDEGNEIMKEGLQVKDEYLEEYQKAIEELNARLNDILKEQNTYEYNGINIDDYIDTIDESIGFDTLDMIDAILGERE